MSHSRAPRGRRVAKPLTLALSLGTSNAVLGIVAPPTTSSEESIVEDSSTHSSSTSSVASSGSSDDDVNRITSTPRVEILTNTMGFRQIPLVVRFTPNEVLFGSVAQAVPSDSDTSSEDNTLTLSRLFELSREPSGGQVRIFHKGKSRVFGIARLLGYVLSLCICEAQDVVDESRERTAVAGNILLVSAKPEPNCHFEEFLRNASWMKRKSTSANAAGSSSTEPVLVVIPNSVACLAAYGLDVVDAPDSESEESPTTTRSEEEKEEVEVEVEEVGSVEVAHHFMVVDVGRRTMVSLIERFSPSGLLRTRVERVVPIGGRDFDEVIVNQCLAKAKRQWSLQDDDPRLGPNSRATLRLWTAAEKAKKAAGAVGGSGSIRVHVDSFVDGGDLALQLSAARFGMMARPVVQKIMLAVREVCFEGSKMGLTRLDGAVFAGGSMKLPALKSELSGFFRASRVRIYEDLDPQEVPCIGMVHQIPAIEALIEIRQKMKMESLSVVDSKEVTAPKKAIRQSIGIRTQEGGFCELFPRGTSLPASRKMVLHIQGGEDDDERPAEEKVTDEESEEGESSETDVDVEASSASSSSTVAVSHSTVVHFLQSNAGISPLPPNCPHQLLGSIRLTDFVGRVVGRFYYGMSQECSVLRVSFEDQNGKRVDQVFRQEESQVVEEKEDEGE